MPNNDRIYTMWAHLRHQLTAWNTGGEGIHSPYLFYIVSNLIYDRHTYYSWRDIEAQRKAWRHVSQAGDPLSPRVSQLLFRLTNYLGHVQARPLCILEIGTSVGITTAYLASASSHNRVFTWDKGPVPPTVPQGIWQRLGLHNVQCADCEDTLYIHARELGGADMVYLNAPTTYADYMHHLTCIAGCVRENAMVVVHAPHANREVEQAWREICAHTEVSTSMDLWEVGILFFDPHYLKRNYRLRL